MDHESLAKQLLSDEAMKRTSWFVDTLAMWLRDGCKCFYCRRDMLESYDVAYYAGSRDHLLPVSQYEELGSTGWNLVLACRTCNGLKGDWDPNVRPDGSLIYARGTRSITDQERAELVQRSMGFIKRKRNDRELLFQKERELIRGSLEARVAIASE